MREKKIHTKLILSLGHWNPDKMRAVITQSSAQQHFINTLIAVLKNPHYNIGGVDIDWENYFSLQTDEVKKFAAFIKALRSALNENHLTNLCLSLDLPIAPHFAKQYPPPKEWAPYVDWANLMAYEFYGGNPPYTELDSALGNVTLPYAVQYPDKAPDYPTISIADTLSIYTDLGIPKRKLVIAWPLYGGMNYISNVNEANHHGLREKIIDDRPTITNSYADIYYKYGIYGKAKKDAIVHQYTFEQPDSTKGKYAYWITHLLLESKTVGRFYAFISYPDPKATKETAEFVKEQGYLGLSAWQLAFDLSFDNRESLLRALYSELHSKPSPSPHKRK
ncbi:glycoside hydrolase family 18 protein [Coxiella burnetii]|uniref:glycoside hydrolase family 18 protein n=1 Tax=Coxiella burnetii TaxID=777 RepID=UPI003315F7F3